MTAIEFNYQLLSLENKLTGFALKLTQDKSSAMDLIQETFVKAIIHRDQFADHSNLKAWAYTIMKNTFINDYRKKVRHITTFDDSAELNLLSSTTESKNANIDSVCATKDMQKEIDKLKAEYKIPFKMHVEGFKYHEIAEKLNLNIGTIKSRIFFARKKLMDALEDNRYKL